MTAPFLEIKTNRPFNACHHYFSKHTINGGFLIGAWISPFLPFMKSLFQPALAVIFSGRLSIALVTGKSHAPVKNPLFIECLEEWWWQLMMTCIERIVRFDFQEWRSHYKILGGVGSQSACHCHSTTCPLFQKDDYGTVTKFPPEFNPTRPVGFGARDG